MAHQVGTEWTNQEVMTQNTNKTLRPDFDYKGLTVREAEALQELSGKIKEKVANVADQMLEVGQYLQEAKYALRRDGKMFVEWCNSSECPIAYSTAKQLMSAASLLGRHKGKAIQKYGYKVLALVEQTKEPQIKTSLLEYLANPENADKVTYREITALKKQLKEEVFYTEEEKREKQREKEHKAMGGVMEDLHELVKNSKQILKDATSIHNKAKKAELPEGAVVSAREIAGILDNTSMVIMDTFAVIDSANYSVETEAEAA
jgi:hypothetical protein